MANEIKKGYDSLMAAYQKDMDYVKSIGETYRNNRMKGLDERLKWVLDMAQKYADWCGTTRDAVLEAWEKKRSYSWDNFYQPCNQPDPEKFKGTPVMLYADWKAMGEKLYGPDMLDWKFKCPQCGHIHSVREYKDAGIDEELAFTCCASRFGLGGNPTCKWTTGGLLRIGGVYVVRPDFVPVLAFAFADEEKEG